MTPTIFKVDFFPRTFLSVAHFQNFSTQASKESKMAPGRHCCGFENPSRTGSLEEVVFHRCLPGGQGA